MTKMSAYTIHVPAVWFKAPNRAKYGTAALPQPVRTWMEVEVYDLNDENETMAAALAAVNTAMMHMVGKTYHEWWSE
jgi:hypothetical protein